MRQLRDMVVIITGASAGIGKALAQQLAVRGAKLVLVARRLDRLEELNRSCGGGHLCVRADVGRREDCQMIIDRTVEHFGRIDTLVCNAGYGSYKKVWETSGQEMRRMFATNFFGTTDLIELAVPVMLPQELREGWRGQIMIVTSAAARRAAPFLGPYSATKAAQLSIAEAARVELKPHRIAVTSVHPIMTRTEFGAVAESLGGVKLPRRHGVHQTVDHVARTMVRAIQRPRAELWPHRLSRYLLSLATLTPGLADRALSRFLKMVERENQKSSESLGRDEPG